MSDPPDSYPADVRETFEYCDECDTFVVSVSRHTCQDGEGSSHKSVAQRAKLAAADNRPLGEDVLYPMGRSSNNAWAYHELDEDGDPLHELDHQAGAETGPRREAIDQGCYPCGKCRVLQERGEDDENDDVDALARYLHEAYEVIAADVGWETQDGTSVDFGELPDENREVMVRLAGRLREDQKAQRLLGIRGEDDG